MATHVFDSSASVNSARLIREREEVRRAFAFHPCVRVEAIGDSPTSEYQVIYTVRTVELDEEGAWQWAQSATMHVLLGAGFPHEPPLVRPMSAVLHPNISSEGVVGLPPWNPKLSLTHIITQIGFMLSYRILNSEQVVSEAGLGWSQENEASIPTDPSADFGVNVGGKPLERIHKFARASIAEAQESMNGLFGYVLLNPSPSAERTSAFMETTRELLLTISGPDVATEIRREASRLEEDLGRVPETVNRLTELREAHDAGDWIKGEAAHVEEMARQLQAACDVCENPPTSAPAGGDEVDMLRGLLPEMAALKAWDKKLTELLEESRRVQEQVVDSCERLSKLPVVDLSPFARPSASVMKRVSEFTESLTGWLEKGLAAKSLMEPALERGAHALAAVRRCEDWRGYFDMHDRLSSVEMEMRGKRIAEIGALFVDVGGDTYGPFEMQQTVALEDITIAVRGRAGGSFDILDTVSGAIVCVGENYSARVDVQDPQTGEVEEYRFRCTERYDDLQRQIQELGERIDALMESLKEPLPAVDSALAALATRLAAHAAIEERHRDLQSRWTAVFEDLGEIGLVKERSVTYFLLNRYVGTVPEEAKRARKLDSILHRAIAGMAQIELRPSKTKSHQLEVPEHLLLDYQKFRHQRDVCKRELAVLNQRLSNVTQLIQRRLNEPEAWGAAAYPPVKVLAEVEPETMQMVMTATDEKILQMIGQLEEALDATLCPATWTGADSGGAAEETGEEFAEDEMLDMGPGDEEGLEGE